MWSVLPVVSHGPTIVLLFSLFGVSGCSNAFSFDRESDEFLENNHLPEGTFRPIMGDDVIVHTSHGKILGKRKRGVSSGGSTNVVDWFLGIPYARPPIGKLRFQLPQRAGNWSGVLAATRFGSVCPQLARGESGRMPQHEDCLYLNVYRPHLPTGSSLLPIMVYVHGGSYRAGSSVPYAGQFLAQHSVVVVTINYRLGLLGFLSARKSPLQGNFGLYDQIAALRWVHENAHHFAADRHRVTVFGNSAGASSVGLLLVSPLTDGLFENVVCQSGSPLSFWAFHNNSVDLHAHAFDVGRQLGCHSGDVAALRACLQRVDSSLLVRVPHQMRRITPSRSPFKPVVDGDIFEKTPLETLRDVSSPLRRVRVMIGTNDREWSKHIGWLFREHPELDMPFDEGMERSSFETAVRHVITNRFGWPHTVAESVIHHYTDWRRPHEPSANKLSYLQFMSDLSMFAPAELFANLLVVRDFTVFRYSFGQSSSDPQHRADGAYHEYELNYLFGATFTNISIDELRDTFYTEKDRLLSKQLMRLWSNFARYGDPTPDVEEANSSLLGNLSWPAYSFSSKRLLFVNETVPTVLSAPRADSVALWHLLVPRLLEQLDISPPRRVRSYSEIFVWLLLALSAFLLVVVVVLFVLRYRQRPSSLRADRISAPTNV